MSAFIGNHDFARFATLADGEITPGANEKGGAAAKKISRPETYSRIKLAFTFLLTNPGIPTIYYGDEIGMTGRGDPDNRRMMNFAPDPSGRELLDYVAKLIALRSGNPAMRYGVNETVLVEDEFYAYRNVWFDNEILVVLNRSSVNVKKNLGVKGLWEDLISGGQKELDYLETGPVSAGVFRKVGR
jgi:glycosidase